MLRLEINHKKNTGKHAKTWKLNNKFLNNEWVNNKIKEEIKRYLETNENEDKTIQNLWDTGKAILRREIIALQAYLRKQEKNWNNLTLHLKELEKEQQTKPNVSRKKEIIKVGAEINEVESKKMIQKINESNSWSFEKKNKIDKPLPESLIKMESIQINKIRNERGEITTDTKEIQSIVRKY